MSSELENQVESLQTSIRKALNELDVGNILKASGILEMALEKPGTVGYLSAQRLVAAATEVDKGKEEARREAHVISGFPGVGKSHLARRTSLLVVQDSDSSKFSWLTPGQRHPHFPHNYIQHIQRLRVQGKTDIILVSSHKEVRDALVTNGIAFTLVYPRRDSKEQYLERYRGRGSDAEFLALLDKKWDEFLDEVENQQNCTKIELGPGQYLSDVVSLERDEP